MRKKKGYKECPVCKCKMIPDETEACDDCMLEKYDIREHEVSDCHIYGLWDYEVAEALRKAERGEVTKTHKAWLRLWEKEEVTE